MTQFRFELSLLALPQKAGHGTGWVVQCLEHDLAAQGRTLQEAQAAFEKSFITKVLWDLRHKREPLADIPPAPSEFFCKWLRDLVALLEAK